MPFIFVYGSLKRGFKQHDRHMKTAHFVAATRTRDAAYDLLAVLDSDATDAYPTIRQGGSHKIMGEVYEIDDAGFKMLDEYEGDDYHRLVIALENGQEAHAYFYDGQDIETTGDHQRIETNGDTQNWLVG